MRGKCRTGGQEAKPFLLLAAALMARGQDESQAWLGSWAHQRECWALERLVLWALGHSGAAGIWWRRQRESWLLVSAMPACDLD